ncbi:porin family protein [Salinimonas sp. HHU 13199]|uniref:Porin family protein n=1 Tax=Salinimonas profundi TaxID=2729140 RepID=A0ABR8LR02_9ALTE|nr:porin family protein [Salinimonas profundi]MBD3586550.1 porin family protein [Salinimonas profundi]
MQRNTFAALVFAGCAFSSSAVAAADNIYVGGNISRQTIDADGRDFNVVSIVGGYKFGEYWSFETRLGKGVSDYSRDDLFEGISQLYKEEIDWQISTNIRGAYPVTENLSVFALVGYSQTQREITSNSDVLDNYSFETKGINYGAGLQYQLSEHISATLEYQIMPELEVYNGEIDWDSLALGVQYHF